MHGKAPDSNVVQQLSHELLLLIARFAAEDSEAGALRLFRETVNAVHGSELIGEFRADPEVPNLLLATPRTRFGGYPFADEPHTVTPDVLAMLRAAADAVAVILESHAGMHEVRSRERRLEQDIEAATRELNARTESYRLVLDSMKEAVYLWELSSDGALRCMEANVAASRMLGYGREELVGLSPPELTGASERRSVADCLQRLRREARCSFTTTHASRDGTDVSVEVEACALVTDTAFHVVTRAVRRSAVDHVSD